MQIDPKSCYSSMRFLLFAHYLKINVVALLKYVQPSSVVLTIFHSNHIVVNHGLDRATIYLSQKKMLSKMCTFALRANRNHLFNASTTYGLEARLFLFIAFEMTLERREYLFFRILHIITSCIFSLCFLLGQALLLANGDLWIFLLVLSNTLTIVMCQQG